jgi:hypothetical protein
MIARFLTLAAAATVLLTISPMAPAAQRAADGYYRTGSAVQTANHWPFTIELFTIWHDTMQLPPANTRRAIIDLDADKRFTLQMMRDLDADKLRTGLREAFHRNGYADDATIDRFLAPLSGTLANGKLMWIYYDATEKRTRLLVDANALSSIEGFDFMRATWSIWFGNSKPSDIGDALIKDL